MRCRNFKSSVHELSTGLSRVLRSSKSTATSVSSPSYVGWPLTDGRRHDGTFEAASLVQKRGHVSPAGASSHRGKLSSSPISPTSALMGTPSGFQEDVSSHQEYIPSPLVAEKRGHADQHLYTSPLFPNAYNPGGTWLYPGAHFNDDAASHSPAPSLASASTPAASTPGVEAASSPIWPMSGAPSKETNRFDEPGLPLIVGSFMELPPKPSYTASENNPARRGDAVRIAREDRDVWASEMFESLALSSWT